MPLLNLIISSCVLCKKKRNYLHTNQHRVCFLPLFIALKLGKISFLPLIDQSRLQSFNLGLREGRLWQVKLYLCIFSSTCGDVHYCDFRKQIKICSTHPSLVSKCLEFFKNGLLKFLSIILFAVNCSVSISVSTLAFTLRLKSCKVLYVGVCTFHITVVL